eukprot:4586009-Pyramimonas_sp.AAC.1
MRGQAEARLDAALHVLPGCAPTDIRHSGRGAVMGDEAYVASAGLSKSVIGPPIRKGPGDRRPIVPTTR